MFEHPAITGKATVTAARSEYNSDTVLAVSSLLLQKFGSDGEFFYSRTVHLDIIKDFFISTNGCTTYLLRSTLKFTLKFTLNLLLHI
jgi:hypothetical protein